MVIALLALFILILAYLIWHYGFPSKRHRNDKFSNNLVSYTASPYIPLREEDETTGLVIEIVKGSVRILQEPVFQDDDDPSDLPAEDPNQDAPSSEDSSSCSSDSESDS